MSLKEKVSGNIEYRFDGISGGEYFIRNPFTRQGWEIPTTYISPDDLRAMADHMEADENTGDKS